MADRLPDELLDWRPFPSEAEWLDLPLPPAHELGFAAGPPFVDRVIAALRDERALDDAIAAEDQRLPRILLSAHEPPAPRPDFVTKTTAALREDRRQRWQHLLARHVAPDPTPHFVARTLAALADARQRASVRPAAGRPRLWLGLAAAVAASVAAVVLWRGRADAAPLELRVAQATSPAFAHAYATSPLGALTAEAARRTDPDALPFASADGTWLLFGASR